MIRTLIPFLLLFLICCSFLGSISKKNTAIFQGYNWEEYDPSYFSKFQKVSDIIDSADKVYNFSHQKSIDYFNTVAEIVRKRFYHGYSHYSYSDNFFVAASGQFLWLDLSSIVIPEDIMKHPMAACSQQAIVMMEIFRRKGIDYRKIAFPHHFAVEAKIDGVWEYFDTNLEPDFDHRRESLYNLFRGNRFDSIYRNVQIYNEYKKSMKQFTYGKINEHPAPNAKIFHQVSFFVFSRYTLFTLLLISMLLSVNFRDVRKIIQIKKRRWFISYIKSNT